MINFPALYSLSTRPSEIYNAVSNSIKVYTASFLTQQIKLV